jgi:hypothetical protein
MKKQSKTKKAAKANAAKIAVGTTTAKYKGVKFDAARVIALFREGKRVSEIAEACGYPKNTGHNRTRRVLVAAGLYTEAK